MPAFIQRTNVSWYSSSMVAAVCSIRSPARRPRLDSGTSRRTRLAKLAASTHARGCASAFSGVSSRSIASIPSPARPPTHHARASRASRKRPSSGSRTLQSSAATRLSWTSSTRSSMSSVCSSLVVAIEPRRPPASVEVAQLIELARLRRSFERVRPQRLQQPVPRLAVHSDLGDDHALVDQPCDHFEHVVGVDVPDACDHCLRRFEREGPGEHAEPAERPLLHGLEAVVAPPDRGGHRLLARHGRPRSAREQAEAVVELAADLGRIEVPAARRGELDGERDAVEPMADLERRLVCHRRRETASAEPAAPGRRRAGSPPTGTASHRPAVVELVARRATAARHVTSPGTPSGSRLVASTVAVGLAASSSGDELGAVSDEVLTVVQHEQRRLVAERGGELHDTGNARCSAAPSTASAARAAPSSSGHRGELDPPHAAGEALHRSPRRRRSPSASCRRRRDR